jgi:hypothetical protein
MRNNHHDRSEATLTFLSCLNSPGSVNWNLVSASFLPFRVDMNPPLAWWKCGNPACFSPDFQARWKEWETRCLSFPRFPRGGISTALLISPFSERSDADSPFVAARVHPSFWAPFCARPKSDLSSQKFRARIV